MTLEEADDCNGRSTGYPSVLLRFLASFDDRNWSEFPVSHVDIVKNQMTMRYRALEISRLLAVPNIRPSI